MGPVVAITLCVMGPVVAITLCVMGPRDAEETTAFGLITRSVMNTLPKAPCKVCEMRYGFGSRRAGLR